MKIEQGSKEGMTLDDLARFVQTAMRLGAEGNEVIRVMTRLNGNIKRMSLECAVVDPVVDAR